MLGGHLASVHVVPKKHLSFNLGRLNALDVGDAVELGVDHRVLPGYAFLPLYAVRQQVHALVLLVVLGLPDLSGAVHGVLLLPYLAGHLRIIIFLVHLVLGDVAALGPEVLVLALAGDHWCFLGLQGGKRYLCLVTMVGAGSVDMVGRWSLVQCLQTLVLSHVQDLTL